MPVGDIKDWSSWALAQADRIDPVCNLDFLKDMTKHDEYFDMGKD